MSISIDFSVLEKQKKNIKPAMVTAVNNIIYRHTPDLIERWVKRLPYCTGKLIKGVDLEFHINSKGFAYVDIFNDVEYAAYIEDGTVDSDGNHALAIAIYETSQNISRDLAKKGTKILKRKRVAKPRATAISKIKHGACKND